MKAGRRFHFERQPLDRNPDAGVRGSRPSQLTRRTGHPLCRHRQGDQRPGHPPPFRFITEKWGTRPEPTAVKRGPPTHTSRARTSESQATLFNFRRFRGVDLEWRPLLCRGHRGLHSCSRMRWRSRNRRAIHLLRISKLQEVWGVRP